MDLITGVDFRQVPVSTFSYMHEMYFNLTCGQVRLSATVTCNQYYLLPCGADGAR